jgi:peptide/nickel transport system substrate-binding protein
MSNPNKQYETRPDQLAGVHPHIVQAYEQLRQGRVSRREFLRLATLLGMSAAASTVLAACGEPAAPEPTPVPTAVPSPTPGAIQRGGTLRVASQVLPVNHPARFVRLGQSANQFRHVFGYLTRTDQDNITHPDMLESWDVNNDLTVWTLNLRRDITWTNGDQFTADDVVFNFGQWLDPNIGSSIIDQWRGFLTLEGVEAVDEFTVRLNLEQPLLAVPEILFSYPALIMHPSFDGNIASGNNPSTGPFILEEFLLGERVRIVRREDYWEMGEDGQPLPYLDAIEWIDLGPDQGAWLSALKSGLVHTMFSPNIETFRDLRDDPNFFAIPTGTSQARVLRFRTDIEPWDDVRYRNAVKLCQDRERILNDAYAGQGMIGHDTHVSPVHPEFAPMDTPAFNPRRARALLQEAGGREGLRLRFNLTFGDSEPDTVRYAELLREGAAEAGITVTLNGMPSSEYLDETWLEAPVGITAWDHRPLAVMVLPLAYIPGAVWNESRWEDEEFTALLAEAQGTLDLEARRAIMAELQRIQSERGSIGIAYWLDVWAVINPGFINFQPHPASFNIGWERVWYDPDRNPVLR